MRITLLILLFTMLGGHLSAQIVTEDENACIEKCNHAHISSRAPVETYYQYPSMEKYDVKYLKLDLAAEAGSRFISGKSITTALVLQTLDTFIIEFKNTMTLDSVFINGVKKAFTRGSDHIYVPLSPALPAGTTLTALFFYNGTASSNGVFAGTVASNGLTYTATLSESYQAREWFPVKQLLSDKIDSADIWVKTSSTNKVGSNGLLVAVVDSPNNKKQYQWKTRYPMNYYLPSISIGNYLEYTNYAKPAAMAPDSIPVLHYIVNNSTYFNSQKANLDRTPAFIEKFSELFGLYPFKDEKYGHAHASIGGGMEHQTMSTMNSFGLTLIAHELGHQWWGDNVTCATWNHIWLNEGFASYCEYLAIEKLPAIFSPTTASSFMQTVHTNVMSVANGSVYVPDASVYDENRIFSSRLSYRKGSAIIHNLRFEIQDDTLFFQALKNFQQQYKDSVATANDFKLVAESVSGKNLTDFFNQWYYGEGYPTFNIAYSKQGSDTLILAVNQTVSASSVTPFFKGLYEFRVTSAQGDTVVKVNLVFNNQQFKFYYPKTPSGIVVDPNNWVVNATGTITNGLPGFDFNSPSPASAGCNGPASIPITLGSTSSLGYNNPISLSASGIPPGTTVSFSVNPVTPGSNTVVTLNNSNTLAPGTYVITVTGISGSITKTRNLSYIIQPGTGPTINTQPASQPVCEGENTVFNVSATGTITGYQWQVSVNNGVDFSNINLANSSSYTITGAAAFQNNNQYRVIISTQCGSTTSNAATLTVNQASPVSFSGLESAYCSNSLTVTLTGNPPGGVFSGPGISGNSFNPAIAGAGNHTVTYTYTNGNGCTSSASSMAQVTICPSFTTLNLKLFLEGFYTGSGTMRATKFDLGLSADPTATDDIMVNLWSIATLANPNPDHSLSTLLHTDGTASVDFPATVSGNSFYIAIKHRNSMETWSNLPVLFTSNTSYDFSNALSKAYDDGVNPPMASMGGNVYAMYGADVNQDGAVDASDMSDIDNDNAIFAFGYNPTDASGDGATDASDISIADNNQQLFLFYARPY